MDARGHGSFIEEGIIAPFIINMHYGGSSDVVSRAQVAFNTALSNKCSASALRSSFYFYFPNPHSINEFEVKHA